MLVRWRRRLAALAVLAVLGAGAPTLARAAPIPSAQVIDPACPAVDLPDVALGPSAAPRTIAAWLDPVDPSSLLAYAELRRLVADERGRLRVDIYLARGEYAREPATDGVRVWAIALAGVGRIEAALREVARDGPRRLVARLGTKATRAELSADAQLKPKVHERLATDRCAAAKLETNTAVVWAYYADNPTSVRLPVFEGDGRVFDDSPQLERLRPELGRLGLHARADPQAPPSLPLKATSTVMSRPELGGVLLGGPGLPHRFVVQARDETDASLFMMLPPVLALRRARPGLLAVHVVARGSSLGADELRHRLCAARILGREVAYLGVLAADPPSREQPPRDVIELLRALDKVPAQRCSEEPDPAQLDLPDGAWLDGLPRARAELANLEGTLLLLRRSRRPLTPLLAVDPAGPGRRGAQAD